MRPPNARPLLAITILLGSVLAQHAAAAGADAASALQGRKVLFVMASEGPNRATDENIRRYLASLGSTITVANLPHAAANAAGRDLRLRARGSSGERHASPGTPRGVLLP